MIVLPFPPSVNRLWRQFKGRTIVSKVGRDYRREVLANVLMVTQGLQPNDGDLSVKVRAYMPDARRRDLDNLLKASLDGLTHARIWHDDSQIKQLAIEHCGIDRDNPRLEIEVCPQTGVTCA